MACVVKIYGAGLNCTNGSSLGNFSTLDYPAGTTMVSVVTCGWPSLRPATNGVILGPNYAYHPAGVTVTPVGCGPDPNQPCDCINGGCVPQTTYNTPGVFPTLAACQSGCAKNSNCTGECVDPAEIAALKQAVNTLQSKICK
jgi:hypothetical protein